MKFDEIQFNKDKFKQIGDESEDFLNQLSEESDFIENRKSFYVNLVRCGFFVGISLFFLLLSNVITLTREVGEPYLTTQDGTIIKIKDYEVRKR